MARTKQTARVSTGGGQACASRNRNSRRKQVKISTSTPSKANDNSGNNVQEEHEIEEEVAELQYDVTYDTSFYAHYFATGPATAESLHPVYALASVKCPFSGQDEQWMSICLNSKYDGQGIKTFGRPTLNLVVSLDISGSMGSTFKDEMGKSNKSKLAVAKESLLALIDLMQPEDSFGLVVFESNATVLHPLTKWKDTNKRSLTTKINKIRSGGGTDLSKGLQTATDQYEKLADAQNNSNRIFLLTDLEGDAMELTKKIKTNSGNSLWSTIIGIDVNLAQNYIDEISKTPGCNYSNVISSDEFIGMLSEEFDYSVTPIGFNFVGKLESESFALETGYGSPEVNNMKPSDHFNLSSIFPSLKNQQGEVRGGGLLFKIQRTKEDGNSFIIKAEWEDLQGIIKSNEAKLEIVKDQPCNLSIRKAVLMVKYTDFFKKYLQDRLAPNADKMALSVQFYEFFDYFQREMKEVNDTSLSTEVAVFQKVLETDTFLQDFKLKQLTEVAEKKNAEQEKDNEKEKKEEAKEREAGEVKAEEDKDKSDEDDAISEGTKNKRGAKGKRGTKAKKGSKAKKGDKAESEKKEKKGKKRARGTDDVDEKKDDKKQRTDDELCVICLDAKKEILLLPCKHVCLCHACSATTNDCPLCRQNIQDKTRVFI